VRDYLEEIARVDVGRVDERRRDPNRVARLLASLARNVATPAAATTLAKDTGGVDGLLKDDTVRDYLGYRREDGVAVIPIGALGP
jgi:uncharacterized protein